MAICLARFAFRRAQLAHVVGDAGRGGFNRSELAV